MNEEKHKRLNVYFTNSQYKWLRDNVENVSGTIRNLVENHIEEKDKQKWRKMKMKDEIMEMLEIVCDRSYCVVLGIEQDLRTFGDIDELLNAIEYELFTKYNIDVDLDKDALYEALGMYIDYIFTFEMERNVPRKGGEWSFVAYLKLYEALPHLLMEWIENPDTFDINEYLTKNREFVFKHLDLRKVEKKDVYY